MKTLVLYIDFDHVIHDPTRVLKGHKMGIPVLGAAQGMRSLRERGFELIIFTTRAYSGPTTKVVTNWLNYFEIPYDRITNTKGKADAYIDNLGYHFSTWPELNRYTTVMWPNAESPKTPEPLPAAIEW